MGPLDCRGYSRRHKSLKRKRDTSIHGTKATSGDSPLHIGTFPAKLTGGSDGAAASITSQFQHTNVRWTFRSWSTCGHCLFQRPKGTCFTQTLVQKVNKYHLQISQKSGTFWFENRKEPLPIKNQSGQKMWYYISNHIIY